LPNSVPRPLRRAKLDLEKLDLSRPSCRIIPPGQPTSLLEPCRERKVRRQKNIKPPETVIVNVRCALRLVGSWPDETSLLREHAARTCARKRIIFEDTINLDRIRDFYATANAFCLLSFAEGPPVVPMEAMAMEVLCATTQIVVIVERIRDGVDGPLVPSSELDALATALAARWTAPNCSDGLESAGAHAIGTVAQLHKGKQGRLPDSDMPLRTHFSAFLYPLSRHCSGWFLQVAFKHQTARVHHAGGCVFLTSQCKILHIFKDMCAQVIENKIHRFWHHGLKGMADHPDRWARQSDDHCK
jgi:hypothetical protein